MKIKICGLKRVEDVTYVNKSLPDYVGFVFAGEKRRVNKDQAKLLKELLDPSIQVVGVFVNEPIDTIRQLVLEKIIDVVQLHGEEDEVYVSLVKELKVPVIRACRVKTKEDVIAVQDSVADFLLFDTYVENEHGGSGKTFAHELLSYNRRECFLAGGLSPENMGSILSKVVPYAIDVSSGVETNGVKDEEKIRALVTWRDRNKSGNEKGREI